MAYGFMGQHVLHMEDEVVKIWKSGLLHMGIEFVVLQAIPSQHHSFTNWEPKTSSSLKKSLCFGRSLEAQGISQSLEGVGGSVRTGSVDTSSPDQHFGHYDSN